MNEMTICANCNSDINYCDALNDDIKDQSFCDDVCFYDWCSDNFDIVSQYYKESM